MSATQRSSLRRLLLQRINLIRKPKDLLAVRDEDQIENSQNVGSPEVSRHESLFTAVEEGRPSRILSDLLVGQTSCARCRAAFPRRFHGRPPP